MNSRGWGFRKWLGTWNWQGRVHEEYVRVISLEGSKPLENKISWVEGSKPLENKRSWVIGVGTSAHYFSRRSGRGGCWRSIWGWHSGNLENSYKVPVIQGGDFKKLLGHLTLAKAPCLYWNWRRPQFKDLVFSYFKGLGLIVKQFEDISTKAQMVRTDLWHCCLGERDEFWNRAFGEAPALAMGLQSSCHDIVGYGSQE